MKLLLALPLAILVILSIMSMLGLGEVDLGSVNISTDLGDAVYYDSAGVAVCYVANLSAIDYEYFNLYPTVTGYAQFSNESGILTTRYDLYFDPVAAFPVRFSKLGTTMKNGIQGVDIGSSIGLIALVIGLMAFATIVGLRVLGSGTSETSVYLLVSGTALLAIWGIFSVLALALILEIDLLGPIGFFILTVMYTVGIITSLGGNNND